MTVLQNPTLAQMADALAHKADADSAAPTGKGKKNKDGKKGDFDESSVKRDGFGQFAKKNAGENNKMDELADAQWLTDLELAQAKILDAARPKIEQVSNDVLKKHGLSQDISDADIPKDVKDEINREALTKLNFEAAQSNSGGISPSGKKRVQFSVDSSDKLVPMVVDRDGPPPDRELYRQRVSTARGIRQAQRNADSSDGMRFNPEVSLDTSRVTQAPPEEESVVDKIKKLLVHSDLSETTALYFIHGESPTLSEMSDFYEVRDVLAHYGIKGMRWGIRRSDRELAGLRDEEGENIGGIHTRTRSDAKILRGMSAGQAVVIESEDGPMAVVKLKDGSFKKVHVSADAQAAVRTLNKEQVEMSTRELKEAAARAKAIEDYNKYFGPKDDANAELQAAVDRLQLEQKYSTAYAAMNPSKVEKVSNFVQKLQPIYDTYSKLDKSSGGQLTTNMSDLVRMMTSTTTSGGKHRGPSKAVTAAQAAAAAKDKKKGKS